MSEYPLAKYSAKIKDVYIELKNYQFFHSPYDNAATKNRFIGREKIKSRIVSILQNTRVKSGSYLITGFRGMGKTSVVRESLEELNTTQNYSFRQIFKKTIILLINQMLEASRILIACLAIFGLLQYFIPGLSVVDNWKFIIQGCILFSIVFLISLWSKHYKSIFESIDEWANQVNPILNQKIIKKTLPKFGLGLIAFSPSILFIFLHFYLFENNFNADIFTFRYKFILLSVFSVIAIATSQSRDFFVAIWNSFKILFVIFLVIFSLMFFFNYNYVCSKTLDCKSVSVMEQYLPVVDFQENTKSKNQTGNFNTNIDFKIGNSNANSQLAGNIIIESKDSVAKKNELATDKSASPTVEATVLTVIFRLILSLLFAYIVLSMLVCFIDLVFMFWGRLRKPEASKKYESFEINLSQDGLDEMEILRRMTIEIEHYWHGQKFEFENNLFNRKIYLPWNFIIRKINRPRKNQFEPSFKNISGKLNLLKNRMSGNLTTRRERKTPTNITTPIAGLVEFSMPLGSHTSNDEIAYQIASVKEAEDQLREILNDIEKLRESDEKLDIPQFVFIIDELDKIDPHNSSVVQERESSNPAFDSSIYAEDTNRFRQRREAVGRLLANLKGFLNVAKAKFFFIGGREMFDADLADIADRESFYSSVFNDVIYVDSFYKDSIGKDGLNIGGITQMTETYLCNIILNDLGNIENTKKDEPIEEVKLNLKNLFKYLTIKDNKLQFDPKPNNKSKVTEFDDELNRQKYKIISTLQNYIIYLTYRSSGTPKKLNGLVEHLIVKGPKLDSNKIDRFFEENVVVLHSDLDKNKPLSERLFLKFGFNTQYELGLTANLYRPYLIANSRHLKSLGDKLLYSSSFIIDHILKFHPFGFSWRNLELIPEVVLVNREPNLRDFIEELMRFYSINYIRDTVSGIFDYRFRSIIRRELVHLSKTSDLSAAAFNFTLDESLATKRYYKRKFYELHAKYKDYKADDGDNQFIHSIYFVQTILGDLHFYDKEYDEAILYYTESIQSLRSPNAITDRKITRHQFLLWVKNKLKLGLTLEKIRAFDSAYSIYKTLILDSDRYFKHIVSKENNDKDSEASYDWETGKKIETNDQAEDHRSIHLICMPFIALLAVTEKSRNDGITYTNLFSNRKDFLKTINFPNPTIETTLEEDTRIDKYRKYYLLADYYNNIGSILYYKNCQFINFFKEPTYFLEAFEGETEECSLIKQQKEIYETPGKPYDFFPSLTPFNYYWNSLYFLLKYHQKRIVKKIMLPGSTSKKLLLKDNLLALCAAYLLPECVDMVSSNRLYYIANVVSKLGDSILASLNESKFVVSKESGVIEEFDALDISGWNKDKDKNRSKNIKWFIDNLSENLFTAETVLYTYKLAAALYKRAGYNSYYASHLTRILYVIKDLIELNKNDAQQKENIKTFLGIGKDSERPFKSLEEIAETVFRATTWNNEVSNRPQILKYRDIFDISIRGNTDRELIYNVINNISDSKEVIVLVESIKMKLSKLGFISQKDFVEKHFTLSKTITSAYGTMSNRYQRMLELKYRTERCFYILKDVLKLDALFQKKLVFSEEQGQEKFTLIINKNHIEETIVPNIKEIIKERTSGKVIINDVVAFLIHEAVFSSSQLIKMIKLYNPGFVIGFSFIAEAHNRMGAWCQAYDNYLQIIDEHIIDKDGDIYKKHLKFLEDAKIKKNLDEWKANESKVKKIKVGNNELEEMKSQRKGSNLNQILADKYSKLLQDSSLSSDTNSYSYKVINEWIIKNSELKKDESEILNVKFDNRIKELLGEEGKVNLESKNHYESAVQYYYKMIQLHSDGKTYKDKLHEIYMLEDDYNDNTAHYTIAAERVRINTGKIKRKINDLNDKIKDSKVYQYNSYLKSDDEIADGLDIETINKYLDYFAIEVSPE